MRDSCVLCVGLLALILCTMRGFDMKKAAGKCLCGTVSFEFPIEREVFDACHCGMCRKWSGGPIMTVESKGGVSFKGESSIAIFESSAWAQRAFCKNCGSHLFYQLKGTDTRFFMIGLIENNERFQFKVEIFIDKKPNNYSFANDTVKKTEAEVFAAHAPKE